jgi:chromosome partitioning protein
MNGKVLTLVQQKGGAGKTTLAAQLAVAFAQRGSTVALVDIDPQGSLTRWFAARSANVAMGALNLTTAKGWRAQSVVEKLQTVSDLVIVDSAPHAEIESKIAVRSADLVVIPLQLSPLDLWATEPTLAMARAEKRKILIVLNRIQPRMKLAEQFGESLLALDVAVATAAIGNRTSFAQSMMEGRGVVETAPRSKAAEEILALADEITSMLARA